MTTEELIEKLKMIQKIKCETSFSSAESGKRKTGDCDQRQSVSV